MLVIFNFNLYHHNTSHISLSFRCIHSNSLLLWSHHHSGLIEDNCSKREEHLIDVRCCFMANMMIWLLTSTRPTLIQFIFLIIPNFYHSPFTDWQWARMRRGGKVNRRNSRSSDKWRRWWRWDRLQSIATAARYVNVTFIANYHSITPDVMCSCYQTAAMGGWFVRRVSSATWSWMASLTLLACSSRNLLITLGSARAQRRGLAACWREFIWQLVSYL